MTGRLEVDLTHSCSFVRHSCASRNPGFPVKTGIQFHMFLVPCLRRDKAWIPVYTGMTIWMIYCSDAHGRPHFNAVRDMSSRVGRPFRKVFTSPEGEGFPPSPKETLNSPKKRKRGRAKCCAARGNCGIESLLCIGSFIWPLMDIPFGAD